MSYLVFNPKSPLSARVFVLMVRPSVEVTRGLNLRFKKKNWFGLSPFISENCQLRTHLLNLFKNANNQRHDTMNRNVIEQG